MSTVSESTERRVAHDEQLNHMLRDRVRILQRKKGYRTSVDAMLLAYFAYRQGAFKSAVDLGAGTGLVSIVLALANPAARLFLIEKQDDAAGRCRENLRLNGVHDQCEVYVHDLADGAPSQLRDVDLVVSNPPFHRTAGRLLPTDLERLTAHYETTANIAQFAACARTMVSETGMTCWVYPKATAGRLVDALVAAGLRRCVLHDVAHRPGHEPITRVLILASPADEVDISHERQIALHPPNADDHRYSDDIEVFLSALKAPRDRPASHPRRESTARNQRAAREEPTP
jgi:tRNA1Val (adenine37-N6)-methyltransferase